MRGARASRATPTACARSRPGGCSNAAELVVPDRAKLRDGIEHLTSRARRSIERCLQTHRLALLHLTEKYGFQRLQQLFEGWHATVADAAPRMRFALRARLARLRQTLDHLAGSYAMREWPRSLVDRRGEAEVLAAELAPALVRLVHDRRRQVSGCIDQLRALSPRLVLERGYCLARGADGSVLRTADVLAPGDPVTIEFARGEADARVETVRPGETNAT